MTEVEDTKGKNIEGELTSEDIKERDIEKSRKEEGKKERRELDTAQSKIDCQLRAERAKL